MNKQKLLYLLIQWLKKVTSSEKLTKKRYSRFLYWFSDSGETELSFFIQLQKNDTAVGKGKNKEIKKTTPE